MGWRRKIQKEPEERSAAPIIVAGVFLLMSVLSFWIPNENLGETIRNSGILSAIFCVIYWLANPNRNLD